MNTRTLAGRTILLSTTLFAGAAAPSRYTPIVFSVPVAPLAVTSAPAAAVPSSFTPAPMPDVDLQLGNHAEPASVSVMPTTFYQPPPFLGDGYTPNSITPAEQSRRPRPTAGLNLSVPLE